MPSWLCSILCLFLRATGEGPRQAVPDTQEARPAARNIGGGDGATQLVRNSGNTRIVHAAGMNCLKGAVVAAVNRSLHGGIAGNARPVPIFLSW